MPLADWARLGGGFAASYWSYLADSDPRPFSATFLVTHRCNIQCDYCYFPKQKVPELTLPQIETVLGRLRKAGVSRLSVTGGEPMVRPDLGEIVSAAKRLGMFVTLNSNLMFYRKRGASVRDADVVFTSLDGGKEAHERQRGPGSWDGVLDAMADIIALGKPVVAICVVTKANVGEADGLLDLADRMGFNVHFHPQCIHPVFHETPPAPTGKDEAYRAFWRRAAELKRRGRRIASSLPYLERLASWEDFDVVSFYDPSKKCAAGRGFLFVEPDGSAFPCVYRKEVLRPVNLLERDWTLLDKPPCTDCRAGSMQELNELFRHPIRAPLDAFRSYIQWRAG